MNVILQCLVACQSFFQLISELGAGLRAGEIGQTTTQTIKFVQQFSRYDAEAVAPVASGAALPPVRLPPPPGLSFSLSLPHCLYRTGRLSWGGSSRPTCCGT